MLEGPDHYCICSLFLEIFNYYKVVKYFYNLQGIECCEALLLSLEIFHILRKENLEFIDIDFN